MTLPIAKSLLSCTCALLLTAALAQPSEAGGFYYAGYGPSYYGYYGVGYRGFGLWGTSYASYYSPSYSYASYYGPSYAYYGSSCGFGCNTCGYGSCGYGCGSCGIGCSPYGASYGSCGSCCNTCGLVSCGGCGIACADGCGTGVSSPASEPQAAPNKPYTPPADSSDPSTFEPDRNGSGDRDFSPPRTPDGGSGEITPDFGNDSQIDREAQKPPIGEEEGAEETIEQRQPAPGEPGTAEEEQPETESPPEPPAAEVEGPMVELPSSIATAASPTRTRLNYTVRFFAPKVARVDIAPNRNWIPVDTETKLAANK